MFTAIRPRIALNIYRESPGVTVHDPSQLLLVRHLQMKVPKQGAKMAIKVRCSTKKMTLKGRV